ncbi:MAG: response regulator [Desulfovibrionaceae bacterium]
MLRNFKVRRHSIENISVLLIDDEVEFVNTLAERMELRGLQVRTAYDGQEGLLRILEQVPDVVLVDMFMPGLSGADILLAVKSRYPYLPVILLTGHAAPVAGGDDSGDVPLSGAYSCLTKPVAFQVVWDTLHAAVAFAKHVESSYAQK